MVEDRARPPRPPRGGTPAAAPPVAGTSDDLLDRVETTRRTLARCRPFLDEEVAATVTAAMGCLDDVRSLARALPADQRAPWLEDLAEIEEMAQAIHAHLVDIGRTAGLEDAVGPTPDDPDEAARRSGREGGI
jgi:hypothetical protein